ENEEEDSEEENEEDEEDKLENFEEEGFNFRLRHFLANQSKDVSLENILEIPSKSLEEPLPKIEEENDETIDYLTGNKIEGMKYQSFEPDSTLSKPDMSSAEKILEEQIALYSHLKERVGHMIGENKNEWNPVTPEVTKKRNYLTGKKFTTGPY